MRLAIATLESLSPYSQSRRVGERNDKEDDAAQKIFLRDIAKEKVSKTAEGLAEKENRSEMTEKDLVDAFFVETPFGFHGPMKTDMEAIGIDYTQYGHKR